MQKPSKPTDDFPLFAHASGSWAKKIKGKIRYFGPWSDPQQALVRYQASLMGEKPQELTKVSVAKATSKPAKPHPGFPLAPHSNGQWVKRIRGKLHYFGPWAEPQAALEKYLREKDALLAGQVPTPAESGSEVTIKYVIDRFLSTKEAAVESGELSPRTFHDYKDVCTRLVKHIDKQRVVSSLTPTDFETIRNELAKYRGPTSLANDINRIQILFKYAKDQELIAASVRYGQSFKKPSKVALRRVKHAKGEVMFQPEEIQAMLAEAHYKLKAMILLGINCGFGNNDCAKLPLSALDLESGWINFPRPKTAIERRCPLWPETVAALQLVLSKRKPPALPEHKDRVFVAKGGGVYDGSEKDNPISKLVTRLLKSLNIHRKGIGFYALRHTFQTIGEEVGETPTKFIMGHAPPSEDMSSAYREQVRDHRLKAVTDHVREWTFKRTLLQVAAAHEPSSRDESAA